MTKSELLLELNITDSQLDNIIGDINTTIKNQSLDTFLKALEQPKLMMDYISSNLTYKQLYILSKRICADILPSGDTLRSAIDYNNINIFVPDTDISKYRLPDVLQDYLLKFSDNIIFKDNTTLTSHLKSNNTKQLELLSNSFLFILLGFNKTLTVYEIDYGGALYKTNTDSGDKFALWLVTSFKTLWIYLKQIARKNTYMDIINRSITL